MMSATASCVWVSRASVCVNSANCFSKSSAVVEVLGSFFTSNGCVSV